MQHYLIITEDGETYIHHGDLTPEMRVNMDEGILNIIDITDPEQPFDAYNDEPLTTFTEE